MSNNKIENTLLKCSKCSKTYKTQRGLASHESSHVIDTDLSEPNEPIPKRFDCPQCGKQYKTAKGLANHSLTHKASSSDDSGVPNPEGNQTTAVHGSLFKCPSCTKKFKSKSGLTKHMLSHPPASTSDGACENESDGDEAPGFDPQNAVEGDVSDDEEGLRTSDIGSIESYFFEDDDEVEEYLRSMVLNGSESEVPIIPKKRKAPMVKCNQCQKAFQSVESYLKHKATHAMSELYMHAPTREELSRKSISIAVKVLEDISQSSLSCGFWMTMKDTAKILLIMAESEEWREILERIVDSLCSFLQNCSSFLTPSELRMEYLVKVAGYSANISERNDLVKSLQPMIDISIEAAHIFFGTFITKLSNEILAFYVHYMVHGGEDSTSVPLSESYALTLQRTNTVEFKQLMHYIGGANVKSLLRAALRIKDKENQWLRVVNVAKKHFLISELASAPDVELMRWTETQDRGGLTKISNALLNFFVELGSLVKDLERIDGSLYIDEVMQKVLDSSKLVCLWDETLKGSIPQEESFKLLHSLCSYFCSTWRTGIISRRLDELSACQESVGTKHGMGGVAFRSALH